MVLLVNLQIFQIILKCLQPYTNSNVARKKFNRRG